MIRLFLKTYLIIALPLILLFLPPQINPITLLVEHIAEPHYSGQMGGVFHLLEEDLTQQPQAQWPQRIDTLSKHFAYPLKLHKLSSLTLHPKERRLLDAGNIVLRLPGQARLLKRVPHSDYVLDLYLDPDENSEEQFILQGPRYLLQESLKNLPVEQWDAALAKATVYGNIPIHTAPDQALADSIRQDTRWQNGKVVRDHHPDGSYSYVAKSHVDGINYVIGPIDERDFRATLKAINRIAPASLLALGILIIAWPLWRHIRKLQQAVRQFGTGELDTRIELSRHSALFPISQGFNDMAQRIQNLIQGQKELTRAVSHELRTPLSRLRFEMEMLEKSDDRQQQQELINGINEDIQELESLVDELLTHSRYEQQQQAPEKALDITHWLQDYLAHYRSPQPGRSINASQLNTASPCPVGIPAEGLTRVLNNLLSNALRHSHQQVRLTSEETPTHCLIHVDDDGPGIPADDRERIFSPFTRLDQSRTRHSGGYGLGLSIVERILKAYGGNISVSESPLGEAGSGARFTVTLPKTSRAEP